MVRARDMALTEQRARHVKESVVIQEQRHALANGPHFSGKMAKLFGWAGTTRSASQSSLHPISSPAIARDGSGSQRMVHDDSVTSQGNGCSVHEDGIYMADTNNRQARGEDGVSLIAADEPRNGESRRRLSSEARANSTDADNIDRCARCVELQQELDVAFTDRALAEAELVALRRTIAPADTSWELESGDGNRCTITTDENEDSGKQDERAGRNLASSSPAATMNETKGLREELGRLERMVAQTNDGVHPESPHTQIRDREPPVLHGADSVGLPARVSSTEKESLYKCAVQHGVSRCVPRTICISLCTDTNISS